ncbi:MAG: flagellar type III secretion system pore protein FliP [Armatimonadetes bacterium]|nr:flagellar type III secretion system pore protein FliP [Armatimonadota bacterium]
MRAPLAPVVVLALVACAGPVLAQPPVMPAVPADWTTQQPEQVVLTLRILLGLAVLSLAPGLLMTLTCFTRIIIVLGFLRSALGTQQTPPNAVLVAFALFLTFFVMHPVLDEVNRDGIQPYLAGRIGYQQALDAAAAPLRTFMLKQTREKDLALFIEMAGLARPASPDDLPFYVIMPAFVISELKSAFQIGFVLFVPFLVIDLVVASTLMSMGMLMVPPVMISLPVKVLLFVMVDGWHLITRSVVLSFS